MPGVDFTLKAFNTRSLSITELFACNNLMSKYKLQMAEMWNSTNVKTSTGRPIDAILCPSSAVVGSTHDTPGYVGYTSLFNILDYPAATIPWRSFKISESADPKDAAYEPLTSNPYDSMVHTACEWKEPEMLPECNSLTSLPTRRSQTSCGTTNVITDCGTTVRGRGDYCRYGCAGSYFEPTFCFVESLATRKLSSVSNGLKNTHEVQSRVNCTHLVPMSRHSCRV